MDGYPLGLAVGLALKTCGGSMTWADLGSLVGVLAALVVVFLFVVRWTATHA